MQSGSVIGTLMRWEHGKQRSSVVRESARGFSYAAGPFHPGGLAALAPIPAFPPVSLSCSSRSSGMFFRWFCRLPPVSLACSSSLVCSSCVAPVSSSRAWVSGDGKRGHLLGNLRICWATFPRALKSCPNRSKMAPRRLQNGSLEASGRPLASLGGLGRPKAGF